MINLNILSNNLDPMTYALLYPSGEPGWKPGMRVANYDNAKRPNISMLQFKVAQTAIRDKFNPIISAGKLTQQWIVDSYLQVEANTLNFIKTQQKKLHAESYKGLMDHVQNAADAAGAVPGRTIILPSSFQGSPRNMRERYHDDMTIVGKFGPPDLFVTFTCNPNWPEIVENLKRGESASDRPDLVARVFKLKLKELIRDLIVVGVLGKSIAFVYTIEFQKRGLPHVHLLIILNNDDKFTTPEAIDKVVCAEIPNSETNPRLYEIVTRCMIHGPCGEGNPNSPCMENSVCSKKIPNKYQTETKLSTDGFPEYKRRQTDEVVVREREVDNRFVVPYNTFKVQCAHKR